MNPSVFVIAGPNGAGKTTFAPVDAAETATAKTAVPQCGPASRERSFDRTLSKRLQRMLGQLVLPKLKSTILCPGEEWKKEGAGASPAGY